MGAFSHFYLWVIWDRYQILSGPWPIYWHPSNPLSLTVGQQKRNTLGRKYHINNSRCLLHLGFCALLNILLLLHSKFFGCDHWPCGALHKSTSELWQGRLEFQENALKVWAVGSAFQLSQKISTHTWDGISLYSTTTTTDWA